MGQWVLSLVMLTGCGTVLGLRELYVCPPNDDDCDQLLNEVDPCPANPADTNDVDHDGVGDECDPNLDTPGDTISEFDGFATMNEAWIVFSGAAQWSWNDSALVQDDFATGAIERRIDLVVQPTVEVYADIEFADEGSIVGAYVATPANVPLECRVVHHAAGDDLVMLLRTVDDAVLFMQAARQLPGKRSDGLRIYGGQLPDGTVRCRARYGDADALYIDLTDPIWRPVITPRATLDRIGVRTIGAKARFPAVVVYSVP